MLEVKLHDIGEGITEGEIVNYLIKEGDNVTTDQPLVEVQTDKMVAELPSPGKGIVKEIIIPTGETVQVGTTLLYIEANNNPNSSKELVSTVAVSEQRNSFNRVLATPYTRKIARDHNINIEDVKPKDPSGRVTEEDVYRFIHSKNTNEEEKKLVQQKDSLQDKSQKPVQSPQHDEIPFRGIRRTIAKNMTKSLFTIPHVTHFDEIDMTNLFKLREQLKKNGISVSVPAFLIKALVFALKEYPIFNAQLDEENEKIILKKEYHIGLATDTEEGLLVPVLRHADQKSIRTIHTEIKQLTDQAINGQLKQADIQNSTITISNVGPLGSIAATPIINYPETALIAFHKTKKLPVVDENDEIVVRQIMTLSMSFDHRVADGATAIAFTNKLACLIAQPYYFMLEMI